MRRRSLVRLGAARAPAVGRRSALMLAGRDRSSGIRRKLLLTRFASVGPSAATLHAPPNPGLIG